MAANSPDKSDRSRATADRSIGESGLAGILDGVGDLVEVHVPQHRLAAELAERFKLRAVSVDRLLIRHLKARAGQRRVKWPVMTEADATPPGSRDWQNLLRLVGEAMPTEEVELLAGSGPILLTCPGLLARYDQVDWLTRLAARAGRTGDPPAIWVLVAGDRLSSRPILDGKAISVIDSSQHAHVPEPWIQNRHRAGL